MDFGVPAGKRTECAISVDMIVTRKWYMKNGYSFLLQSLQENMMNGFHRFPLLSLSWNPRSTGHIPPLHLKFSFNMWCVCVYGGTHVKFRGHLILNKVALVWMLEELACEFWDSPDSTTFHCHWLLRLQTHRLLEPGFTWVLGIHTLVIRITVLSNGWAISLALSYVFLQF